MFINFSIVTNAKKITVSVSYCLFIKTQNAKPLIMSYQTQIVNAHVLYNQIVKKMDHQQIQHCEISRRNLLTHSISYDNVYFNANLNEFLLPYEIQNKFVTKIKKLKNNVFSNGEITKNIAENNFCETVLVPMIIKTQVTQKLITMCFKNDNKTLLDKLCGFFCIVVIKNKFYAAQILNFTVIFNCIKNKNELGILVRFYDEDFWNFKNVELDCVFDFEITREFVKKCDLSNEKHSEIPTKFMKSLEKF